VNAGIAAARQRGVTLGRPVKIRARVEEVRALKSQGFGLSAIARQLRMPVSSVFKAMKLAEDAARTEAAPVTD
jgi:DNA invertase Pin-like site-specific DNA recombinase